MSTRGERISEDVRAYLATNGLKQSQLTGAVLAELIDRRLVHEEIQARKKKRLATEEDWIKELEAEPHLAGVNVRKELAAAQFWCKNNARQCTRKFFLKWLEKSARDAVLSPGGAAPKIDRCDVYKEPPDWKASERARKAVYGGVSEEAWANITAASWFALGTNERKQILMAL